MRGIRQLLPRRPGAREALAWLLVAAFLVAPWQVSVAASGAASQEVTQTAEGHGSHQASATSPGHDAGLPVAAGAVECADDSAAVAHSVSCCKGICSLCPGLFGDAQGIGPQLRNVRTQFLASSIDWLGLTPELFPQPPKFA